MLFKFGKVTSPRLSLCKLHDETIMHLFYGCLIFKRLWNQLTLMHPLGWMSLRQRSTAPIPGLLPWGPPSGVL